MNKKVVRFFTSRYWRCHKRRLFFESIFEELKNSKDSFSGIKYNKDSFSNTCRELAGAFDFYPTDKTYSINVGKYFSIFHTQTYDSLNVSLLRETPMIGVVLSRRCTYLVKVEGTESGSEISYTYSFTYPSVSKKT